MDLWIFFVTPKGANNPGKTKEQANHGGHELKIMISELEPASVL